MVDKKDIKVCHVTSAHSRYDVRIFHKECKSLAKNGFDVTLLVNDSLEDELIDGVSIKSTNFNPRNRFERMIKSQKHIKRKAIEIDAHIYHLHDPELLPLGNKLKRLGRKSYLTPMKMYQNKLRISSGFLANKEVYIKYYERYENIQSKI